MIPFGDINYQYVLEELYGRELFMRFSDHITTEMEGVEASHRNWWKELADSIEYKHASNIGTCDETDAEMQCHYLSIEDALILGDVVFRQFYGAEVFKQMLDIKYSSGVTSEAEFIDWLLNKVSCGGSSLDGHDDDFMYDTEGINYSKPISSESCEGNTPMKNAESNETGESETINVKSDKLALHVNLLMPTPVGDVSAEHSGMFRRILPKLSVKPAVIVLKPEPSQSNPPQGDSPKDQRQSQQQRYKSPTNLSPDKPAQSNPLGDSCRDTKQRRRQRYKPLANPPPGKPFRIEMTKNDELGIKTALSFAGLRRGKGYKFFVDVVSVKDIGKPYICSYCKRSFHGIESIKGHIKDKHPLNERIYRCDECDLTFGIERNLRMHVAYKHEKRYRVQCNICGAVLSRKRSLQQHVDRHDQTRSKKFKCDRCGKMYYTKSILKTHINQVHMKQRSYICSYCGLGCRNTTQLNGHVKIHEEERTKYSCPYCDKIFLSQKSMDSHISFIHEKSGGCACEVCGKMFAALRHLKAHIATHGEKKYACTVCSLKFRSKRNLRNHAKAFNHVLLETDVLD